MTSATCLTSCPNGGRIEEGEFSAIIRNTPHNTEYTKTKVLSMTGGYTDATTNHARMSVEKRGDAPTGGIAWRFLTTDDEGVDTIGGERDIRNWDFNDGPYFWKRRGATSIFNVQIQEGGPGGPELYNFGKHYGGFYNPVPQHVIWLGFGPNRSGRDSSTVPGMITSKVWVFVGSTSAVRESVSPSGPGGSLAARLALSPSSSS